MSRFTCALACAPLVPWVFVAPAHGQTADAAPANDILVVGQTQKPISIEPRGLSVSLGDEQFAGVNAANVEDLMKYAPDFFVRTRFIGDNNAVPGFRGTHSTQSARTLAMVDGFVISNFLGNSFNFPPAWGVVSPNEVQQFDIVYGPYSARYGGNSMGGIVNITTRPPDKTELFVNLQNFFQPYDQFKTREDLWGWSAEGGFAWKPKDSAWGVRVSARRLINQGQPMQFYQLGYSASAYNDPSAGTPIGGAVVDPKLMPVTGTKVVTPVVGDYSLTHSRQDQARAELRYDAGAVHGELLFAYWWNEEKTLNPRSYITDAAGRPFYGDATGLVSFGGHGYTLNAASSFRQGLAYKNEYLLGGKIAAPVAGFDVQLNISTLRFARQDTYQSNGYAAGLADGAGQWTHQGPTGWYTGDLIAMRTIGRHAIAFGVDGNRYETDQSVFATTNWRTGTAPRLSTRTFGRSNMIGGFAEDAIALDDATRLTLGVRYDRWRAYDGGITAIAKAGPLTGLPVTQLYASRSDDAWSPKIALRHVFAGEWIAELSLAMATRFPTVGELFQGSLNGDGSFNPNSFDPKLKPERSKDANLLLRHRFGPVTLTGSAFYQRVRNTIFQFVGFNQNGVSTSSYKNIDLTRQYGLELIAETRDWPVRGMDIDGNGAWIDAITVSNPSDRASEGVQFPRIPRWRLNGNLRYRVTPALQAVVGVRYASRPNTDLDGLYRGDDYGYTSELFALDLKANVDINDHFRLSAGVNNLTNDRAWVYHPYPQRTFMIEAGVKL
ncbi:TonB-dependent receptor [Sphingomonas lycopersici]|uniref:TonB-dependent receptor n=1 Tax=Sphingomonas lycopersici TaxID=2951807 RepID=A0AA41ZAK8_9SPHN|nr:TonB-dependent receptor [Sphingomonas lycopersici]MCW6537045.1 TonB-dependent receptor [Sphingomonas lycopersici]